MGSKLHIVYATDSRYLLPTLVAAASAVALASRKEDLIIDILDCGVEDDEWHAFETRMRTRLGNDYGIVRHKIDPLRYAYLAKWHGSYGAYARLDLPQILAEVDWCVYCDGDTLFTADPFKLCDLWNPEFAVMAHRDAYDEAQIAMYTANGYQFDREKHFCSGFMLLNLVWFRQHDATRKCFDVLKAQTRGKFFDQDALNVVCSGCVGLLPDEWGEFTFWVNRHTKPGCFHYAGRVPWEQTSKHNKIPMTSTRALWFNVLQNVCGLKPYDCLEYTRLTFYLELAKSYVFAFVFRLVNSFPGISGRYNKVFDDWWAREKIREFFPITLN